MATITLTKSALMLLERRLAGERVDVTDETRPLYLELVDAGLMMPMHTCLGPIRLPTDRCRLRPAGEVQRDFQPRSIWLSNARAAWLIGSLVSGPAINASSWSPPGSCFASSWAMFACARSLIRAFHHVEQVAFARWNNLGGATD